MSTSERDRREEMIEAVPTDIPPTIPQLEIMTDDIDGDALTVFYEQPDGDEDLEAYYRIETEHVVDLAGVQ